MGMLDLPRPRQLFARGHTTLKSRLSILGAAVTLQLDWPEKIIPEIDTLGGTRAALLTMQTMGRSLWEVELEIHLVHDAIRVMSWDVEYYFHETLSQGQTVKMREKVGANKVQ